jgi:putative methionine-R-sulfoxide reductase with GAF domain
MAIFSAYANDEGYENVFAEQLENLIKPDDVVIGISASGNSKNVLKAIELANKVGSTTIGFTGFDGGHLKSLVKVNVHIPSSRIGQVEDIHLMLEHMVCETLGKLADATTAFYKPLPYMMPMDESTKELAEQWFNRSFNAVDQHGLESNQSSRELLYRISQEFAGKFDLHEMLCRVLTLTLASIGAASGTTIVMNEQGEVVDGALAYAGQIQSANEDRFSDILHHGLAGWVVENRKGVVINNTQEDPRWLQRSWEQSSQFSRSALSVPLITNDRVVGVITLVHPQPGRFTLEDLALLTAIIITISYSFEAQSIGKIKVTL